MRRFVYILTIISVFFCSCDRRKIAEKFVPVEEKQVAEKYVKALLDNDFDKIINDLSPEVRTPEVRSKFEEMTGFFPDAEPIGVTLVGFQSFYSQNRNTFDFEFQYEYTDRWILVGITLEKKANVYEVLGVHVTPLEDSLQNINAFSFKKAKAIHYFFLMVCIFVPVFSIFTLIKCARTRPMKRKWLWIIFILFGFVQFKLNWTTGQVGVVPLSFLLLGTSAFSPGICGPWILSFAIPVGAIIFLIKKPKLVLQKENIEQADKV